MIANILSLLRKIFDRPKLNKIGDTFTYVGDDYFNLLNENPTSILEVKINGSSADSGISYELTDDTKEFYITGLTLGDIIEVKYYYTNYSDDELTGYIQEATGWVNIYTGNNFIYTDTDILPSPTFKEQNVIAFVAMILVEPELQSYSLPNYKVSYPKKESTDDKIKKVINNGLKATGGTVQFN